MTYAIKTRVGAMLVAVGFLAAMMGLFCMTGCTVMTQEQKDWVTLKAERSSGYVSLMDAGQTTPQQNEAWIRQSDEGWQLWKAKVALGLAAPSWSVKPDVVTPVPVTPMEVD